MGNLIPCCELTDNKGEEALRTIIYSFGLTNITEINFRRDLKEKSRDDIIQTADFLEYMDSYWSQKEPTKQIQISLFNKYFSATLSREINIYELSLLLLPLFNLSIEEKRKTFQETIKSLTYPKYMFKNIKEMVNLYYNFHTIFITKIIYYELKNENKKKESNDLRNLLLSVFTEEQVHKEVDTLLKVFENDINKKTYLTAEDIEMLSERISMNFGELRDYFINKYSSM